MQLPGLERLRSITDGSPEVCIAVLDGPVDASVLPQSVLELSSARAHGTHVCSIIAGSADGIAPGIAPGCRLLSIPIFETESLEGRSVCSQQDLAAAITTALQEGANILNISASQQGNLLSLSSELGQALQEAFARDALVVAAAGNHGCACETIPASVPGVLAVGAHDGNGAPLLSSNWGLNQRSQGVLAPGKDVAGACVGGGLCRASGTSFAAATVSGIAGLLMSADAEKGAKPAEQG